MDTRSKILTLAAARQLPARLAIAAGYFDVLRAEHARELSAIKEHAAPLLVVVLPLEDGLLGQRARAELAAALRVVDYVVAAGNRDLEPLIDCLQPIRCARLECADARRRRELIEHVRRRHAR
ncbi:MAG: hypothetical protein LAQ30_10000 [Acidobacteriia bacterium]|nr:hypothetical protein [Terriglobia bacterium]